jgi:hypothetical protein
MKNIHILPTDKPSKLAYDFNKLILNSKLLSPTLYKNQNIYITDDSKIRERDWFLNTLNNQVNKCDDLIYEKNVNLSSWCKKIILTTDQDLIKDGVQAIDDEFLQWFVKNPSCEKVEVIKNYLSNNGQWKDVLLPSEWEIDTKIKYKIIIPQEESKNTCPKCRTTDFDNCHSIKCPMRKEEPKQELPIINGSYGCTIETFKQETLEEFAEKLARAFDNDNYKALMDLVIDGAKFQAERMYSEEEVIEIVEKSRATGLTAEYLILTEQFKRKKDGSC